MFSVQYTGMNLWPLWTAKVSAIMSGVIIERRDQVLMMRLSPEAVATVTFFSRCPSTNGPFYSDLTITFSCFPFGRRLTIKLSDGCFLRVLYPLAGWPHGDCGWLPFDLPSPPPCGWSTGFIATPRT